MTKVITPQNDAISARISDSEFQSIRKLVYDKFGINLTEQKKTLVVGRLQKVLRERKISNFRDYITWLNDDTTGQALDELSNKISTNHTFFNREKAHFEYFVDTVLPAVISRREQMGQKELRIWCAGSSSGEEPYTLMMLLKEFFGSRFSTWKPVLLATDLSASILQTAMAGKYEQERVDQLPPLLKNKYFQKCPDGRMQVVDDIKKEVYYRRHNLMDETFPFKKQFDIIFCRNVMIYFDEVTRLNLVSKYYKHTVDGGYLFIGHSETLGRGKTQYNYVKPAVYQKS